MENKELIQLAIEAQKKAYVPYSKFSVGAAVFTDDERVFTGCNIENASYTPTICAERVAIFKAISEGSKSIKKIAIVAGDEMGYPCGVCRQVMMEFAQEAEIIVAKNTEEFKVYSLKDLLPHGFGPKDLEGYNV
ncbi:cytidine deaminase [Peptoniphilus sp. KCTC 25270]|uniref:cytidine deaminase n=1 Tax=Peptoniphilus sp. KCTC 25270 TaxID=2897414 RepID=UPI001E5A3FA6|nr:cytidine deaminase [Peptoniphilus sp. KCTC 25270]MCD1146865.1 cytidine deaminase [Peptoniphilus sp. KCTC 25270]